MWKVARFGGLFSEKRPPDCPSLRASQRWPKSIHVLTGNFPLPLATQQNLAAIDHISPQDFPVALTSQPKKSDECNSQTGQSFGEFALSGQHEGLCLAIATFIVDH